MSTGGAQTVLGGPDPAAVDAQTLLVMAIAIGVLALVAWLLRRGVQLRRPNQLIAVETAVPLGERRSLVIVAVEGRRLLLGLTPGQVSLVTELRPPFSASLDRSLAGTNEEQATP
jgi:flagellar protein FliO/FliZ